MDTVENFMDNLEKDQRRRQQEHLERRKEREGELGKLKETLAKLKDETNEHASVIDKNLSSITSYKHSIHATVREPREDAALPISNVVKKSAVRFFNDAMLFVNYMSDYEQKDEEVSIAKIDTERLQSLIRASAGNLQEEIVKLKNKLAAADTVAESLPVLRKYIESVEDEEEDEEPELDASLQLS